MGSRTRISGRAGTTFGGLLLLQILLQLVYFAVVNEYLTRGDFGTVMMAGDVSITPDPLSVVLLLTVPLEIVSTLLYLASRWVSMAFLACTCAWSAPFLILVGMGPSIAGLFHMVLPLAMLVHIHCWTLEDGPRVSNPFPGRAPEPFR